MRSFKDLKFFWWSSQTYSSLNSMDFACQQGCYPWHGTPFNVSSDGHNKNQHFTLNYEIWSSLFTPPLNSRFSPPTHIFCQYIFTNFWSVKGTNTYGCIRKYTKQPVHNQTWITWYDSAYIPVCTCKKLLSIKTSKCAFVVSWQPCLLVS